MPDPDSAAVARRGTAAANGVSPTDPDELVAQIDRTRENLAETIDVLAERLSPANNIRKLRERVQAEVARPEVQAAGAAVGLILVGLIVIRFVRRRK